MTAQAYMAGIYISAGSISIKTANPYITPLEGKKINITGGTIDIEHGDNNTGSDHAAIDAPDGSISAANVAVTVKNYKTAIGSDDCNEVTIDPSARIDFTPPAQISNAAHYREKITINTEPLDSAALTGNSAVFVVNAYGHSSLSYQWQTSPDSITWTDAEGQTQTVYSIPVTADNNGSFVRCKITNGFGNTVYSDVVTLYQLAFSQQPQDISMTIGTSVPTLNAQSTCTNVTYQWQRSVDEGKTWVDLKGETYTTLILGGTLSDNGSYRCVITATNGDTLASDAAEVTVSDPAAPVTYKTVYYLQNADGMTYTPYEQDVASAAAGTGVTAPVKTYPHYTENAARGTTTGTVSADGKTELSRYYDRVSYTITFDTNGGTPETPLTALHGAAVSAPLPPTKAGCTFGGWFRDRGLTEPYSFTVMPTESITVYAKWDAVGSGRGIEYQILSIGLRGEDYRPVSSLPKGRFYAEVSVKNLSSTTTDTLTLATYDADGRLLDLYYLSANPPVGYTFTLGASIDNSSGSAAKLKAFVLPALGGVVPLAEAVEWGG